MGFNNVTTIGTGILLLTLSGSSTCITHSAPDGYFRNEDCWHFSNFVCDLNLDAVWSEPPEGKVWFIVRLHLSFIIHNNDILFRKLHPLS